MTTELDQAIIATSIRDMVDKGYFSISTIDSILKVTRVQKNQAVYDRLHMLHCVHFNKMPPEVLDALPAMIRDVLNGPEFDIEACFRPRAKEPNVIEINPAAKPKRGLFALPWRK